MEWLKDWWFFLAFGAIFILLPNIINRGNFGPNSVNPELQDERGRQIYPSDTKAIRRETMRGLKVWLGILVFSFLVMGRNWVLS